MTRVRGSKQTKSPGRMPSARTSSVSYTHLERLDAGFQIHYMDVPLEELRRRLEVRSRRSGEFCITREWIDQWARQFEPPLEEESCQKYGIEEERG